MELKKAIFPKKGDYYLKNIFEKIDESIQVQCGTVFLNKGDELPLKTLEYHEVAYLVSGKLMSYTKEQEYIMNPSDLIYILTEKKLELQKP